MAIALIASVSVGGTGVASGAINTTGATLLVMEVTGLDDGTPTVSDSKSNTWVPLTKYSIASSIATRLYYVASPTVGSGHTFTATFGGGLPSLAVKAFSGVQATPFDQENGATLTSAGTSHQPGSVTPSEANELVVTGIGFASEATESNVTIDSSFLPGTMVIDVDWSQVTGGDHFGSALAYKIQSSASAENPTWTWTGSNRAVAAIATFKSIATVVPVPHVEPSERPFNMSSLRR